MYKYPLYRIMYPQLYSKIYPYSFIYPKSSFLERILQKGDNKTYVKMIVNEIVETAINNGVDREVDQSTETCIKGIIQEMVDKVVINHDSVCDNYFERVGIDRSKEMYNDWVLINDENKNGEE